MRLILTLPLPAQPARIECHKAKSLAPAIALCMGNVAVAWGTAAQRAGAKAAWRELEYRFLPDRLRCRDIQLYNLVAGVCAGLWNFCLTD